MPAPHYLQSVIETLTDTAFRSCETEGDAVHALMSALAVAISRLPNAEWATKELAFPLMESVKQAIRKAAEQAH